MLHSVSVDDDMDNWNHLWMQQEPLFLWLLIVKHTGVVSPIAWQMKLGMYFVDYFKETVCVNELKTKLSCF